MTEAEAQVIIKPSLNLAVNAKYARDKIQDEIDELQGLAALQILIRTKPLQDEIEAIRQEEEEKIHEELRFLRIERDLKDEAYHKAIVDCLAAGIREEGSYYLKNTAKFDRPINVERFKIAFPEIWERCATIQKNTAKANLVALMGMSTKVAEIQLEGLCDEIIVGQPKWELEVRRQKA